MGLAWTPSGLLGMYQPALVGKDDGLGSVAQMKFGEDAFEVGLDGVLAKEQRAATSPLESPRATSTRISCSRLVRSCLQTEVAATEGARRLERLVLRERASGGQELVDAAALFVMIGATPHTGWLPDSIQRDDRGFIRTGPDLLSDPPRANWPLDRPPLALEASLPGVFPVGDIRAGSVKRVASAVGEGSVAIQQVHQYLPVSAAGKVLTQSTIE